MPFVCSLYILRHSLSSFDTHQCVARSERETVNHGGAACLYRRFRSVCKIDGGLVTRTDQNHGTILDAIDVCSQRIGTGSHRVEGCGVFSSPIRPHRDHSHTATWPRVEVHAIGEEKRFVAIRKASRSHTDICHIFRCCLTTVRLVHTPHSPHTATFQDEARRACQHGTQRSQRGRRCSGCSGGRWSCGNDWKAVGTVDRCRHCDRPTIHKCLLSQGRAVFDTNQGIRTAIAEAVNQS
mmetsp:Transcript_60965/g.142718  ORF Transcript_60965/g.142718 Transcript_60965/m.142718 type:complete len:238 (+) Transcript_60965:4952-5665(+)